MVGLAQTSPEELRAKPCKAGGVYLAYPVPTEALTPAPKGYKPVYISHYGRHGSRYLIGDRDYGWVVDLFNDARQHNALTEKGKDVCDRLNKLWPEVEHRGGDLSSIGVQRLTIRRMCSHTTRPVLGWRNTESLKRRTSSPTA